MQQDDIAPSGYTYARKILDLWLELIEVGQAVRKEYLSNGLQTETFNDYVARLVTLWWEFQPKVENRTEAKLKDIASEFNEYRKYALDPKLLMENTENIDKVVLMEEVIRKVMDKLELTRFE